MSISQESHISDSTAAAAEVMEDEQQQHQQVESSSLASASSSACSSLPTPVLPSLPDASSSLSSSDLSESNNSSNSSDIQPTKKRKLDETKNCDGGHEEKKSLQPLTAEQLIAFSTDDSYWIDSMLPHSWSILYSHPSFLANETNVERIRSILAKPDQSFELLEKAMRLMNRICDAMSDKFFQSPPEELFGTIVLFLTHSSSTIAKEALQALRWLVNTYPGVEYNHFHSFISLNNFGGLMSRSDIDSYNKDNNMYEILQAALPLPPDKQLLRRIPAAHFRQIIPLALVCAQHRSEEILFLHFISIQILCQSYVAQPKLTRDLISHQLPVVISHLGNTNNEGWEQYWTYEKLFKLISNMMKAEVDCKGVLHAFAQAVCDSRLLLRWAEEEVKSKEQRQQQLLIARLLSSHFYGRVRRPTQHHLRQREMKFSLRLPYNPHPIRAPGWFSDRLTQLEQIGRDLRLARRLANQQEENAEQDAMDQD